MINILLTITVLFFYYQFAVKYLNVLYTILYFLYLENNELLIPPQSGFHPNNSCTFQLISIVHNIYEDFDHNPSLEVRRKFLDISKAFDKVWH